MKIFYRSIALVAVGLIFSGCLQNNDNGQTALSKDSHPSACSLLDVTKTVFGPAEFRRSTGKPQVETAGFEVPAKGEVCVLVTNGTGDPPHGKRISAAWISIDGVQVIGPEAFSQVAGEITAPHVVLAGSHDLAVRLASNPGSFITVEIRFLAEDREPPLVSIQPANGEILDTDLPLLRVYYHDDGVGVDLESLQIEINGSGVTTRFQVGSGEAAWQVGIDDYLEEGLNGISASISDRMGNAARTSSIFLVATPTEVLISDLTNTDWRYRKRSAYKLLFRLDEISLSDQRRCLKQLNETPEPKATDRLLALAQSSEDNLSRALAAGALGEAVRFDPAIGVRADVVAALCLLLFDDEDFIVKAAATRAMGFMQSQVALDCLDDFLEDGPNNPPQPGICNDKPLAIDCQQHEAAILGVNLQVTRAATRIAGQDHSVGNPGDMGQARAEYLRRLQELLDLLSK